MEFTTPISNATVCAPDLFPERQPDAFNWQHPTFHTSSPRAQASGSTRVPGTVMSHRPRWTPEKHARILARIKATRTDIDPSFPRAQPVPADAPQTSAQSLVKGAIQSVTQTTMSYIDSFTECAFNLLYDGPHPAAPTGGHPTNAPVGIQADDHTTTWKMAPDAQKQAFIASLVHRGLSERAATDAALAWTAIGIPLIEQTLPTHLKEDFKFLASEKHKSGSSQALVMELPADTEGKQILKCFPPASKVNLLRLNQMTGVDQREPKLEARCVLASHIAHELLHWDIIPKAALGFFGGRVCVVTPYLEGTPLLSRLTNNMALATVWMNSMHDGTIQMAMWKDHTTEQFRNDYTRILLFSMLIGDYDRHPGQFIVQGKRLDKVKSIDWDITFGSKVQNDAIFMEPVTRKMSSLWPDAIPKVICDEFAKVSAARLTEAAQAFGLTGDEVKALLSRFEVITKKLATIQKT